MPILTATEYQTARNTAFTGGDLAALNAVVASVNAAITTALKPFSPEPLTVSSCVLDAPASRDLILPVTPARSITSVYYRADAYGLAANFTSDYLLDNTNGDEYQLLIDDPINGWARQGILRRIGVNWAVGTWRYPDRLGYSLEGVRGAVMVTYTAGFTAIPDDIKLAAILATSMVWERREKGVPLQSEGWNGYSASLAGAFVADGVMQSPDVAALLRRYQSVQVG